MVAMIKSLFVLARVILFVGLSMCSAVLHAEQFNIKDVQVDGLISLSEGFVVNSLPVRIGQTINDDDFNVIIQKLYETGYFADIKLSKAAGDVLVIKVQERPTIKSLSIKGNKALKTDPLLAGLSAAGLAENKPYNPSILGSLKKEIERQYVSMGMRGSQVQTKVTPIKRRNAVNVVIQVKEAKAAKIRRIAISGNRAFSDSKLKGLMSLRDSKGLAFWSKKNRYLKQQLSADLDRIETFYRNNGYLKFAVESAQVNVDKNSGGVIIDLAIREGNAYRINDLKFLSQEIEDTREIDQKLSELRGRIYSKKQITELERVIKGMLGKQGFAFARVKGVPKFREAQNKVDVIFALEKGKRSYVRRINFTGNTKTQDDVLRREMRQLESAPANTALIEQSRLRLMRLGFF
ncbi:MAG: outer membrane protein assembly factor BamA, partial [Pseudomonadota bacterium]